MSQMIDLIRRCEMPPQMMRAAAKGALSVPAAEMIEILVFLTKNPVFAEEASLTLARWDEAATRAVAADPQTSAEVLDYLLDPKNRRPAIMPALVDNPAVSENRIIELARTATGDCIAALLGSARVSRSAAILEALSQNPSVQQSGSQQIKGILATLQEEPSAASDQLTGHDADSTVLGEFTPEEIEFLTSHAEEIASEEGKPFQLIEVAPDEAELLEELMPLSAAAAAGAGSSAATTNGNPDAKRKMSVLQKIAGMSVGQRVQLAMKGNKDERFLLIRDGAKVVALAVLESPKITDTEADLFASMKNVQEIVLRGIASKRKFMKRYSVIRNLIWNPKCPIDLSLNLLNHLMVNDLKHLSTNKEVPETVRKMALRLFLQKSNSRQKSS